MKETFYNFGEKQLLKPRSDVCSGIKAFISRFSTGGCMLIVDTPRILAKRSSGAQDRELGSNSRTYLSSEASNE